MTLQSLASALLTEDDTPVADLQPAERTAFEHFTNEFKTREDAFKKDN